MREFSDLHKALLVAARDAFLESTKFNDMALAAEDTHEKKRLRKIAESEMGVYHRYTDQVTDESGCELWELIEASHSLSV